MAKRKSRGNCSTNDRSGTFPSFGRNDGGNWTRIMCNLGASGSTARRNPLNSVEQSRSLHWCVISRGSLHEKRKCEGVRSSQRRTESGPGAAYKLEAISTVG